MAKVFSVFEFRLSPDMEAEEFERFVKEDLTKAPLPSGARMHFLKCDRDSQGDLIGTYSHEIEYESMEVRDRYFPKEFESSEEFNQWWAEHGALWAKFHSMVDGRFLHYFEYVEWEGMSEPAE